MISIMQDKRGSIFDAVVKGILFLISVIYSLGIRFINWMYISGIRRSYKAGVPVISVGNITLGGTGKTPFTIFLAEYFLSSGRKPAVLVRGYGDDECRMLKDELPDVPVFVGQDRIKSAYQAVSTGSDILVLDDGFQHRRIDRDLNVLMIDGSSPFGNGELFPRGVLREPISAIRRADMIVITKTDKAGSEKKEDIIQALKMVVSEKPIVFTRHKTSFVTDVTGSVYSTEMIEGKKICLLSGIVDPDYFAFLAEKNGAVIGMRRDYPDHYRYRQSDINLIAVECTRESIEFVVTTAKDYVKIKDLDISCIEEKIFIMNVVIDIVEGKEKLIAGLNSIIAG